MTNKVLCMALFFTVCTLSMFASTLSTFIMQAVSYYHVSPASAGTLESYQNLSLLVFLFTLFPLVLKLGYKKSLMAIIAIMVVIATVVPIIDTYWAIKMYLVGLGLVFMAMKVIVYSTAPLAVKNESSQAMLLSFLESSWAIATLVALWVVSYFLHNHSNWLHFTWIFAGVGILCIFMWSFIPFDESKIIVMERMSTRQQLKGIVELCKSRYVLAAIGVWFIANFLEMGVGAWLPSFYQEALSIPNYFSIKIASFAMLAVMLGRIAVIGVLRYFSWGKTLLLFYGVGLLLLIYSLFHLPFDTHVVTTYKEVPVSAFLLLAFTFFLAPSAPLLNSSILARTSKEKHALLMTLLTIFFAIASSIGARIIGDLIVHCGVIIGFRIATIIPIVLLVLLIIPYEKFIHKGFIR